MSDRSLSFMGTCSIRLYHISFCTRSHKPALTRRPLERCLRTGVAKVVEEHDVADARTARLAPDGSTIPPAEACSSSSPTTLTASPSRKRSDAAGPGMHRQALPGP